MNIKGGALEFDIIANNGQINSALEETKKRVQGFSDATVEGGAKMEVAYQEAAATIEKAFKEIDVMAAIHSNAIKDLEKEYSQLGKAAADAFMKGTAKGDDEYRALIQKQQAVHDEITQRKQLLQEIGNTADALQKEEQTFNTIKEKVDANSQAQITFRTQLRNAREELTRMEQAGLRGSEAYNKLQQEVGRLKDAMDDANQQATVLANDEAAFQGIVSAISGISGAFSAAQGAVGLFAGENENLQKVMLKVQSLMAITIGLQQVAQTLNKDSYFSIVLLGGIKKWWAGVLAKATISQTADTAATVTNTVAQQAQAAAITEAAVAEGVNTVATGAQTVAATAGTVANIGLAGAFRLVGAAIKSIPVIGWILAGISALIGLVSYFSSKAREAKKAQQELNEKIAEMAGKPISAIEELAYKWNQLGGDLEAKKKFIEENADKFKELGVAVNSVSDAERLLVEHKEAFISAEIEKAKAMAIRAQAAKLIEESVKNQQKLEEAQKTPKVTRYVSQGQFAPAYSYEIDNPKIAKYEAKGKDLEKQIKDIYDKAADAEIKGINILKDVEIEGIKGYEEGTIGALEATISKKQEALKKLSDPEEYKKAAKEIEGLQKQVEGITGKKEKETPKKTTDPYTELLENRKKQYTQYYKWVNSKDEIIQKAAKKEFSGLLAEGNSYLEYLKNQREKLLEVAKRSPEQKKKLSKLNDEIANETKNTVLGEFEKELQTQLNGAHSIMEMLNILEERRKALETDNSGLKGEKTTIVDKEQEDVGKKAKEETDLLLNQYSEYLSKRIGKNLEFENQMQLLRQRATKAETEEERKRIQGIATLYEQLHALQIESFEELDQINADSIYRLGTFEQKRLQITKDYEKLIGAARMAGHHDVAKKLEGERDLQIMRETKQYQEFFGDISEVSIKTLENTRKALLSMMQASLQAGKITADEYKRLIDEINKQMDSAYKNRGIESLFGNSKGGGVMNMMFGEGDFESKINSFKTIFSGAKGDMANMVGSSGEVAGNAGEAAGAMKGMAGGAAGAISMVDAIITAVYQTIKGVTELMDSISKYKESMGEDAEGLNEWSAALNTMNEGVMGTWEKLKSGDVIGSMTNSISWILDMGTLFNTIHDNRIEKSIQQHADAVKVLSNAYKALAWSIDKALGETVYKNQKAAIENMRQQQAHLLQMKNDEESKKKTDADKVREYQEQYDELGRQVEDMISSIADSITQTTAKDLANELADALVEAFGKGEDAATAFEEVSRKVMQNAVKNALKLQFLEKPLQNAIKQLQRDMGFDDEGNGSFDGLTQSEQNRFKNAVAAIGANYSEAMKMYEGLFKDLEESTDPTTSLSGAIKGASQESIDLLAGQTNAVRVNQVESIEILRQQLIYLELIASRIGTSNKHLESIDNKIGKDYDPLRSQGLI